VDIGFFNPAMRLSPPLRQQADREALRAALADGTIDALVSDHTPVDEDAKTLPFGEAEPGATGLELLLSLALKWGQDTQLGMGAALARVTSEPVKVLGDALGSLAESAGRLVEGGVADLCVFDPDAIWQVQPGLLKSQGKHTPFDFAVTGTALPGRVRATLVAGTVAYQAH
jgi:dihydroorotase